MSTETTPLTLKEKIELDVPLSVKEIATAMGWSQTHVYKLMADGVLRANPRTARRMPMSQIRADLARVPGARREP